MGTGLSGGRGQAQQAPVERVQWLQLELVRSPGDHSKPEQPHHFHKEKPVVIVSATGLFVLKQIIYPQIQWENLETLLVLFITSQSTLKLFPKRHSQTPKKD